eukprot:365013-Chlamydomonas_euryale.AAC.13
MHETRTAPPAAMSAAPSRAPPPGSVTARPGFPSVSQTASPPRTCPPPRGPGKGSSQRLGARGLALGATATAPPACVARCARPQSRRQ